MATKGTKNKRAAGGSSAAKKKYNSRNKTRGTDGRTNKIIVGAILILLGIFLFATVTVSGTGPVGSTIGGFLKGTLGHIGVVFPLYLILLGIVMLFDKSPRFRTGLLLLSILALLMLSLINSGRFIDSNNIVFNANDFFEKGTELKSGGLIGMGLASFLVKYIGKVGLYIISVALFLLSVAIIIINSPIKLLINEIISKKQDITISIDERKREREERKSREQEQRDRINAKKEIVNEIKERNRQKRNELKNKAVEEPVISPALDNLSLFPENHNPMPDTSSVVEGDIGPAISSDYGRFGIEDPRITMSGYGLEEEDGYDYDHIYSNNEDIITDEEVEISTEELVEPEPESVKPEAIDDPVEAEPSDSNIAEPRKISKAEIRDAVLTESDFNKPKKISKYKKPPIDLLEPPKAQSGSSMSNSELQAMAELLENTLRSFNVDARVINVTQGPSVTRYEIQPNVGVKVSKIVNLADDIALNLRAKTIRIEAPIPGKPVIGIEIGNDNVNMVKIRELIDSKEFKKSESKISFTVGKDIAGKPIVADLKTMPHLLIAGSTGSGKSVCINSIITSILYKANPDEVKLVLIDPKVVELGDYNGIPHLLIPVVTDPTKAAAALNWSVAEMTDRYKKFAEAHVRDLESYNEHAKLEGEEPLPQVVIIIDELADLMMAAHAQVEESICRLAQLARAAGMHLIVATQRPSVNVVTGLIKANIPSRIAFAVASQYDSKTILDMGGAEKLGGKGDMLYAPLGIGAPIRVQGCFIGDDEIHRVIDFVKNQSPADYSDEVIETINKGDVKSSSSAPVDDLFDEAVQYVIDAGKASTSLIQRYFRIGYNRAANIIDEMERRGIIGPADGSKPRQVYATAATSEPPADNSEEEYVQEPELDDEPVANEE